MNSWWVLYMRRLTRGVALRSGSLAPPSLSRLRRALHRMRQILRHHFQCLPLPCSEAPAYSSFTVMKMLCRHIYQYISGPHNTTIVTASCPSAYHEHVNQQMEVYCGSETRDMVATEVAAATAIAAATSTTKTTPSSWNLKGSQLGTLSRLYTGGHTVSCDAVVSHLPEHLDYRE